MGKIFKSILLLTIFAISLNGYAISYKNAKRVINSKRVVVVKFWASWCIPCNILKPEYEEAKKLIGKKALLVEYNVDQGNAKKFGVYIIPTIVIYVNGKEVDRRDKVLSAYEIKDWVLKYVK